MNILQRNITLVLVAFSLVAFVVFLVLTLKIFDNDNEYYLRLADARGLMKGDGVFIDNENLGKISKIDTLSAASEFVIVKLTLNRNINLPDRSVVYVNQSADISKKRLEIELKPSSGFFSKGDTLKLFEPEKQPEILVQEIPKADTVAQKEDTIPQSIDTLSQPKVKTEIKAEVKPEDKPKDKPKEPAKKAVNVTPKKKVVFKVQFLVWPEKLPGDSKKFKELKKIDFYIDKGSYKYVVGSEQQMSKAVELCEVIKKQGFPDAFVVAFQGDKRITIKEAQQILQK